MRPDAPMFQLAAGVGRVVCNEKGLCVGEIALLMRTDASVGAPRWRVRSLAELNADLGRRYGVPIDLGAKLGGLHVVAAALDEGNLARAQVAALHLRLPEPPRPDASRDAESLVALVRSLQASGILTKSFDGTFDEAKHPRWPAGSPDSAGGRFAPAGAEVGSVGTAASASPSPHLDEGPRGAPTPATVRPDTVTPVGVGAVAGSLSGDFLVGAIRLPNGALELSGVGMGPMGLVVTAGTLMAAADAANAGSLTEHAIERFHLDPARATDVVAARAYVWATFNLPGLTPLWGPAAIQWSGAQFEAASEAVMRLTLVDPSVFLSMERGDERATQFIVQSAQAAIADSVSEARPASVAPWLQANSAVARAAIADELRQGNMQAHHLVPAAEWGRYAAYAELAYQAGWRPNGAANLIGLPADVATQAQVAPPLLPLHSTQHRIYSADAQRLLKAGFDALGQEPSPQEARGVFDEVALLERLKITAGFWNPKLKMSLT
jgi:hypothetical protein